MRVDALSVLSAELVEVQPFSEFGGCWDKRSGADPLLAGTGRTALRVSYRRPTTGRDPKTCRPTS